jgi:hypothetical protein
MRTRVCSKCKIEKDIREFPWETARKRFIYNCILCERIRDRDRYKKGYRTKYFKLYNRKYKVKHPEKNKARIQLSLAIKQGKIKRQPCIVCGNKNSHGHHEDYSKPLEVIWLCRKHHEELHHPITPTTTK